VTERCTTWSLVAAVDDEGVFVSALEAEQCPNPAAYVLESLCASCGRAVSSAACDEHVASEGGTCFECGAPTSASIARSAL
jgi:hypothetical protein